MSSGLPEFRRVKPHVARRLAHSALTGRQGACLLKLVAYDDGRFRAIFRASYFSLQGDSDAPSRSQWNTLKKRFKRRNRSVFIFREYGALDPCPAEIQTDDACLYLDFGFMAW